MAVETIREFNDLFEKQNESSSNSCFNAFRPGRKFLLEIHFIFFSCLIELHRIQAQIKKLSLISLIPLSVFLSIINGITI